MNTVTEITRALPRLSNEELGQVERALHQTYRARRAGLIYDDAHGVWTEEDQAVVAAQTFALLDAAESPPRQ